jgi:ACS family pantothenate transporter-like MFS transporter
MAACKNFSQLATCGFFRGAIEASTYSSTQYVIGECYTGERGKLVSLFSAYGQAGTMFTDIVMTAIYSSIDGLSGLVG